jgi:hypothetical protein
MNPSMNPSPDRSPPPEPSRTTTPAPDFSKPDWVVPCDECGVWGIVNGVQTPHHNSQCSKRGTLPVAPSAPPAPAPASAVQEQEQGWTKKDQPQEPTLKGEGSVFLTRHLAADIARVAHYLLGTGFDGVTKLGAANQLVGIARRLNACAERPWTDAELTTLLGRAVARPERAPVLAVDRSRSTPDAPAVDPAALASRPTEETDATR